MDRIFATPDLSGPRLREPKFSPDGRYITYLQGKSTNKDQLDLWAFDTRTGANRLLVDSQVFSSGPEQLSAEEEARRERQRTASLRGIVDYEFSSDGSKLLVPLSGDLYVYDLQARSSSARKLTSTDAYETDARFSPRGNFVSFIRDQDLFAINLASGVERAITTDGEGLIQNGVAEFVAQEEMDRNTGYWWSPDESQIAFTRVDDSPVEEVERFEINAEGAKLVRQHYPAAGKANAKVELSIIKLDSSKLTPVVLPKSDGYLARVTWLPDSKYAAVQWQSRDQKRLDLLRVDASTGEPTTLLTETSTSWVELHDDLKFLKTQPAFVWASRRTGFKHLYLFDLNGKLIRPLTQGDWMVVGDGVENGIVGVDEAKGLIYFSANEASPLERHLYSAPLNAKSSPSLRRISKEPGGHDVRLVPGGVGYLDTWSSPEQPSSVSIRNFDGTVKRWVVRNALDASHPYHPFLASHVKEEFGSIKATDGQDLYYRLLKPTSPSSATRLPVVIDTYGGPHAQHVRKDWMGGSRATPGLFRQLLVQRGFVVFSIDNRGSGFRGVTFESALQGQLGKVEVEDQVRGVEFLKTLPFVDPARIGIMGWSYGGYMSLMALAQPNVFKAAVSGAPVVDWSLYDTHYTERYLGTPAANASGYERSSVVPYIDKFSGRLLLVHGMADDNVLFTNSTMLMQRLQAQGKRFDLMTYPGGKHGLIR
ncbi:MAG TPA: S9 family peptidase, partial [Steroidobacteraceae bacterium]|nr:S9 family peptidase [Steroidobacteraceae bacterium]